MFYYRAARADGSLGSSCDRLESLDEPLATNFAPSRSVSISNLAGADLPERLPVNRAVVDLARSTHLREDIATDEAGR